MGSSIDRLRLWEIVKRIQRKATRAFRPMEKFSAVNSSSDIWIFHLFFFSFRKSASEILTKTTKYLLNIFATIRYCHFHPFNGFLWYFHSPQLFITEIRPMNFIYSRIFIIISFIINIRETVTTSTSAFSNFSHFNKNYQGFIAYD